MSARIDRWLWAVRIFKTRNKASEACRGGKVSIDGISVKPSRDIRIGETVHVKQRPIVRSYRVMGLAVKRVSAKIAQDLVEEITPREELDKLTAFRKEPLSFIFGNREKGAGRPTKKERRDIEKLLETEDPDPD